MKLLPALAILAFASFSAVIAQEVKPLKVLLITGGCCHDYKAQKDILKKGIEERINAVVDQIHSDDKGTKPPLAILGNADYAKGYDVVIHDECAADIKDPKVVEAVLAPHKDGIPGVNLHCGVHSYRVGDPNKKHESGTPETMWFDYLGLQSSGHGPQLPIAIAYESGAGPITKGLENWTTMKEELYNNIQIFPSASAVAKGTQTAVPQKGGEAKDVEYVVAWTNLYGKTRVFSTTIGHNNDTVGDARYLDFLTRGLLWATGKLKDDGTAVEGFGPAN